MNIGERSYYNGSNTFITPNDVFESYISTDAQTGKQSTGTNINYESLASNVLVIYIPTLNGVLIFLWALGKSPKNRGAVVSATVVAIIFFAYGAVLTYSFYITPLKQQSYANSLVRRNAVLMQQLKSK